MTFTHKLKKALQPQTYLGTGKPGSGGGGPVARYRAWREHKEQQRIRERRLSLTVENLLASVPPGELARVQTLSEQENTDDVFWTKYLDVNKWLTLNIRYVKELGMVENPPRDVLDLGCGGGFFLVAARHMGARVLGFDLDKDQVLNEMIRLFGLRRVAGRIRAFVKLPDFGRKFDLITAFMICFNFPPKGSYWGVREWDFFLHDVTEMLTEDGRLLLSLNKQPDGKEYDDTLRAFFESRGGVVQGKRIVFTVADLRRTGETMALLGKHARTTDGGSRRDGLSIADGHKKGRPLRAALLLF